MVELVDSAEELQANLAGIRDDWCADPATMPDSELRAIAGWAWKCRLENRIYRGRDSAFPVQRLALDALRGQANGADAIALSGAAGGSARPQPPANASPWTLQPCGRLA